jgi:parallel beta-helix repeat protein
MKRKLFVGLVLAVLVLLAPAYIQSSKAQDLPPTILIKEDGSISPATVPIQRDGDTYTFTGDIYATIKIFKSNIALNGADHTLWGQYTGGESDLLFIGSGGAPYNSTQTTTIGVDLGIKVEGITVSNLNVKNFSIGIYMWTQNNTITDNTVTGNIVGIMLSGSNTTISNNYIANNSFGIFYGFNNGEGDVPDDIIIAGNSFVQNRIQLNGCQCSDYNTTEPPHNWDNGREGNYWSDYNGTDTNQDGVGDTYYVIDILNQDRYPLMAQTTPTAAPLQFPIEVVIIIVAFVCLAVGIRVATGRFRRNAKASAS